MSAIRTLRPRSWRPTLSSRYQHIRRHESTIPTPPPPPSFTRRNRTQILLSTLAITLGFTLGTLVTHTLVPPSLPDFGTREDTLLTTDLTTRLENEFKVQVLRGKCLGVSSQLKNSDKKGWVELIPRVGPTQDEVLRGEGMIAQLQGFKGLGVERLFWNFEERTLVAVVWFGGSLSGWPGVTHGGVIATQLSEKLALAAALGRGEGGEVEGAVEPQRMPVTGEHAKMFLPKSIPREPGQLSLTYVKPTYANNFYVIRVKPAVGVDKNDSKKVVPGEPKGGHEYEAELETMDAKVCVKAQAKFETGSAIQQGERKVIEGAKRSYAEFKEWMWPSRQRNSETQ